MTFSIADAALQISENASRRFRGWGRVGMLVLLLSVFFQSYVAQTHIHHAGQAVAEITAQAVSPPTQAPQSPLSRGDDGHADCLLCQAVLHAGAVVVPAVLAVLLPALLFLGLAEAACSGVFPPVLASHGWRSRAPPLS